MKKAGPVIAGLVGITALVGATYGVLTAGGFVVSEARAAEIAQLAVNVEAVNRERADLQLQLDLVTMQLGYLLDLPRPTAAQKIETDLRTKQIERIEARLEKLP